MPFNIIIKSEFCAAMKLSRPGPCSNLHGHTYSVESEFSASSLDETGITVDYYELEKKITDIVSNISHQYLNEHEWFKSYAPSLENIAVVLFQKIKVLNNSRLKIVSVSISESKNCKISYAE